MDSEWILIPHPPEMLVERDGKLFGETSGNEYECRVPWNPKKGAKWYVRKVLP